MPEYLSICAVSNVVEANDGATRPLLFHWGLKVLLVSLPSVFLVQAVMLLVQKL